MTVLVGFSAEQKQACLVFLSPKPFAHRPFFRIDLRLEEQPVWNLCSFQPNGACFRGEQRFGLIATP